MEYSQRKYTVSLIVISERKKSKSMGKIHFSELMEDRYHQNQEAEAATRKLLPNNKDKERKDLKSSKEKKLLILKGKMISITSNFSIAPIEIEDQNNIVKVPRENKC